MTEGLWKAQSITDSPVEIAPGIQLRRISGQRKTFISGAFDRALNMLPYDVPITGTDCETPCDRIAVRMARDRVLVVTPEPVPLPEGWHEKGFSVSIADDAWTSVEVLGRHHRLLSVCMTSIPGYGSRSAAVSINGHLSLLVRSDGRSLIFVETPMLHYHWALFTKVSIGLHED